LPYYDRPRELEYRTRKRENPTRNAKQGGADMQPTKPIKGSPAKIPCANIGFIGTAEIESLSEVIPLADSARKQINLPAVPLYLIAPVLSREIHTHKGVISEVIIRRSGQHRYKITLVTNLDTNPGQKEGAADAE
jgi:hypothetical protein